MVVRIICFVKWSYQVNQGAAADEVNDEDEQRRGSPNYLLFLFSTEGCPILSEEWGVQNVDRQAAFTSSLTGRIMPWYCSSYAAKIMQYRMIN